MAEKNVATPLPDEASTPGSPARPIVALVTGGASGLGKAAVERHVADGGKVAIADLASSKGEEVASQLGENAIFVAMDVTSEDEVKAGLRKCADHFGRLDAIVNCAGVVVTGNPHPTVYDPETRTPHDLGEFKKVLMVNTLGTFNVIRLACAVMHENEPDELGSRGVIVNAASIAAYEGLSGMCAYSTSKGGIGGMTVPIARDLSGIGIRICAVAPGLFETPMVENVPAPVKAYISSKVPHPKQLGDPKWFADVVQFIFKNPYMNGEIVRIDGCLRLPY